MLTSLRHHSDLRQRTYEAELTSTSLQYLSKCKAKYLELSRLLEEQHLPNAVTTGAELQQLLDSCPSPLNRSKAILDLRVHTFYICNLSLPDYFTGPYATQQGERAGAIA